MLHEVIRHIKTQEPYSRDNAGRSFEFFEDVELGN
jgi:hypothetical protein